MKTQPVSSIHDQKMPRKNEKQLMHDLKMEKYLAFFACALLGLSCLTALALFCLQGFHAWGFRLETSLMHWIGAVTVGTVAAQAATVFNAFFRVPERTSPRE
jgi:hypothetical protein